MHVTLTHPVLRRAATNCLQRIGAAADLIVQPPVALPPMLRNALCLALLFMIGSYTTVQAESLIYTDTIPTQPMRWTNSMTFPQFDPTLGILTSVEMTLTGTITGSTSYTNQVGIVTVVSIDIPANLRLASPTGSLLNAGGTIFSFTENVGPNASGARTFGGTVSNSATYSNQPDLLPFVGFGQLTTPVTATSSFIAGGDVGNFDFGVRTTADATGVVRYTYAVPEITIKKFTNGFDADHPNDPDVPQLQPGATVTWTYRVTNTGTITIPRASVVVTDSQPGVTPVLDTTSDTGGDNLLAPGETWIFVATGVVQDLEAPTAPVTIVNGCNPGGGAAPGDRETYRNLGVVIVPGAEDSDPSHYCNPAEPGIVIKKYTNAFDADQPNDSDVPQLQPGAVVTWTYVVTNTGNITFAFASVVVTDSQTGVTPTLITATDNNGDGLLSPGESWRYVATGVVQNLDAPTPGTVVVNGCNPGNTQVPGSQPTYFNLGQVTVPGASDNDPSHYCNPPTANINLEKTVYLGHNAGAGCPGTEAVTDQVDAPVTYCFEITNTGETYLDTLIFTDTILGIQLSDLIHLQGTIPLAPNAQLVYYYEATIPIGERINTAEVEANPTDDQGNDLPGLDNPHDQDTAQVSPLPTGTDPVAEPTPKVFIPLVSRN
ncbi:MAG: choice-of-anchor E domain-containing protein [Caldilineaceae bacterium]